MMQWFRLALVPELRSIPEKQRLALMTDATLRAMSDPQVRVAGFVCSACAAAGAFAGSGLFRGLLLTEPLRFFAQIFLGAMLGGMAGGVIYAVALLSRTRPHVQAALARSDTPRPPQ